MVDIYSSAKEVLVWLGRSEADRSPDDEAKEHLAFSLINKLDPQSDASALDLFDDFVRTAVRENPLGEDLKALSWMFNHPWFTRLPVSIGGFHTIILVAATFLGVVAAEIEDERTFADTAEFNKLLNGCHVVSDRGGVKFHYDFKNNWENVFEALGLEKQSQLDTLAIMSRSRRYKCRDPRDRIFAILHMLKDEVKLGVAAGYRSSLANLYCSLTMAIVTERQDLAVLRLAGLETPRGKHSPPLPSWVVDWHSDPMNHVFLWEKLYQSCPEDWIESVIHFEGWPWPSPTVCVPGIHIDIVIATPTLDVTETVAARRVDCLSLWKSHFKTYPTGCDPNHAWVRTSTGDLDVDTLHPRRLDNQKLLQYNILSKLDSKGDLSVEEFFQAFPKDGIVRDEYARNFMFVKAVYEEAHRAALRAGDRTFFISKKGYMGIGPRILENGDAICILPGSKVPLLVREKEGYHLLVGECFVWGLMDGEAFSGKEEEREKVKFWIR